MYVNPLNSPLWKDKNVQVYQGVCVFTYIHLKDTEKIWKGKRGKVSEKFSSGNVYKLCWIYEKKKRFRERIRVEESLFGVAISRQIIRWYNIMIGTQLVNRRCRHHRPSLSCVLIFFFLSSGRSMNPIMLHVERNTFTDTCLFINWQTNPFYDSILVY